MFDVNRTCELHGYTLTVGQCVMDDNGNGMTTIAIENPDGVDASDADYGEVYLSNDAPVAFAVNSVDSAAPFWDTYVIMDAEQSTDTKLVGVAYFGPFTGRIDGGLEWALADRASGGASSVVALNAWYSRRELLDPMGAVYDDMGNLPEGTERRADAFAMYAEKMAGRRVTVVGHFPYVERIARERGGILTVLERNCTDALDMPDPTCEYLVPEQDFLFITGVALTNKTATCLLELARMGARPLGRLRFALPAICAMVVSQTAFVLWEGPDAAYPAGGGDSAGFRPARRRRAGRAHACLALPAGPRGGL